MTIESTLAFISYEGDGSTVEFPIPFPFVQNSHVRATLRDASNVETVWTLGTEYTLLGAGNDSGGTLTADASFIPQSGERLVIELNIPNTQGKAFPLGGAFPSTEVEEGLDLAAQRDAQLKAFDSRVLHVSSADTQVGNTLIPLDAERAGKYLGFGPLGEPVALSGTSQDVDLSDNTVLPDGGSVSRALKLLFSDFVNVKSFAVGDGVADDTTALNSAVSLAQSNGATLLWPSGTYLTTASIANLHSIKHFGPGVIRRGSDDFKVAPMDSDLNVVYVAASGGSDSNDGLSASQPLATIPASLAILRNYRPVLTGTWRIQLAAGTYTDDSFAVPNLTYANNPLQIYGPSVSGGVPTAIVDGTGGIGSGFVFNKKIEAYLRDVKLINFGARTAVIISQLCDVDCDNVHVDGAGKGIAIDELSKVRVRGGIIDNCTLAGVDVRHANASVGLVDVFDGPTVQNCATGVAILECSNVHVDDLTVQDCDTGILTSESARSTLNGTVNLARNTGRAIRCQENGVVELIGTINFNDGTANSNALNEEYFGGGGPGTNDRLATSPTLTATKIDAAFANHTGDTTETTLRTYTDLVASNSFASNRSLKFRLLLSKSGSAATAQVRIKIGTNTVQTITIPAAAGTYIAEVLFMGRGTPSSNLQRSYRILFSSTGVADGPAFNNHTFDLDDSAGDQDGIITVQLGNAGDTVNLNYTEIYETG